MSTRIIFALMMVLSLAACRRNSKQAVVPAEEKDIFAVKIPNMITDGRDRAYYLAEHFWDAFSDTTYSWTSEDTLSVGPVSRKTLEQKVGMYASLLKGMPVEDARKSLLSLFSQIENIEKRNPSSELYETVSDYMGKYLYDPQSPLRNESVYHTFVKRLAESPCTAPEKVMSYEYEAQMSGLNNIGSRAADFAFTDRNGKVMTLYGVKAELVLLFFSNPGCNACKEVIDLFSGDEVLKGLVTSGKLAVVNVYIDQDLQEWRKYLDHYPAGWFSGYDHKYVIRTDQIYNIRAIPSLYLLDGDKTVLMKDAPLEDIYNALLAYSENS